MNNLSDTDNNRVEIEEEIVLSVSPAHFNQEENVSKKIIHDYFLFICQLFRIKSDYKFQTKMKAQCLKILQIVSL